jgi:hypothetical protein
MEANAAAVMMIILIMYKQRDLSGVGVELDGFT